MNFVIDPHDEEFRMEARVFIEDNLPRISDSRDAQRSKRRGEFNPAYVRAWTRVLSEKGWSVPRWPVELGGTGWTPAMAAIFDDELFSAGAPMTDAIGIGFVGPVLYTYGSPEQKSLHLPGIRSGAQFWCQGFSESHAGSDVMSIRTLAVRASGKFVVNGRKHWISNAHNADMMFALVRVQSPGNRRQQGLSFLLIDMKSPGVQVTPIISLDGRHWINEVSLDSVLVPEENLIGEQGQGWVYARFLLSKERAIVAGLPMLRRLLVDLKRIVSGRGELHSDKESNGSFYRRIAQFQIELGALEFLELRVLYATDDAAVESLAPMLKLRACELRQKISETMLDAVGENCLEYPALFATGQSLDVSADGVQDVVANYLFQRSATIAGGTSEVQRNIIAGLSLGI